MPLQSPPGLVGLKGKQYSIPLSILASKGSENYHDTESNYRCLYQNSPNAFDYGIKYVTSDPDLHIKKTFWENSWKC